MVQNISYDQDAASIIKTGGNMKQAPLLRRLSGCLVLVGCVLLGIALWPVASGWEDKFVLAFAVFLAYCGGAASSMGAGMSWLIAELERAERATGHGCTLRWRWR